MIKPTRYDADGYPVQWLFQPVPANSLACVNALIDDCRKRQVLGEHVDIRLHVFDECSARVNPDKLIKMIEQDAARAFVAMVGVQSNQFPRTVDLARPFLAKNIPVCVGGFHVSGCLSMLKDMPDDLKQAQAMGISFFAGESEGGRMERIIKHAYANKLEPIYNYISDLPEVAGEPSPFLPASIITRNWGDYSSFDMGRGCPFQCSFCTIINVHGRKSRFRTAEDLGKVLEQNAAQGVYHYFVADDDLARNQNWKELFDTLAYYRHEKGYPLRLAIQVDTQCHKIPGFINKAMHAGVRQVFVGMENINPDNLLAAKKHQNKITDYREMMQEWKKYHAVLYAGYIIGFPHDTKESVLRDVEIIKQELPVDMIWFSFLTPLPGSEDHKVLYEKGAWLDPDMSKYNLNHRVSHHPKMTDEEWEEAYYGAWKSYYTAKHMRTIIQRSYAFGGRRRKATLQRLMWYRFFPGYWPLQPLEGGYFPIRFRKDRKSSMKQEHPFVFYPRVVWDVARYHAVMTWFILQVRLIYWSVLLNPRKSEYRDLATTPPGEHELEDDLELFTATQGGQAAVERKQKQDAIREKVLDAAE
jgi:hypothetical protein